MTDLEPEDAALLELARRGHEPTDADRVCVRSALVARLGVSAGLTSTTAAGAGGVATGAGGASGLPALAAVSRAFRVGKALAAIALVGAAGAGVTAYWGLPSPPPVGQPAQTMPSAPATSPASPTILAAPPSIAPPAPRPAVPERPRGAPAAADPAVRTMRASAIAEVPRAPSSEATARRPVAPIPASAIPDARVRPSEAQPAAGLDSPGPAAGVVSPSAIPEPPVAPTTIDAEMRLVRSALQARRAGDAAGALRLLGEHARAYPNGVLAEESAAERVFALCDLGRVDEARRFSARFVQANPRSLLNDRVKTSCVGSANP